MDGIRQYRTPITALPDHRHKYEIPYNLRPSFPPALPPVSYPPLWSPESLPKYQWFTRHPIVGYPHLQIPKREFLDRKRVAGQPAKIKAFIKAERRTPAFGIKKKILVEYLKEYQIPTKKRGFTNKRLQKDLLKPWFKQDHIWLTHQVKHSRYIMGKIDDPEQMRQSMHESRLGAKGLRAASSMWKQWCFYRNFLAIQRARPGYQGLDSMTITYQLPWEDRHCCWPYLKERHGWPWASLVPEGPYDWSPYWWHFRQEGDVPLYCAKRPTSPPPNLYGSQIGPHKKYGGPGFEPPGCDYSGIEHFHCN